MYFTLRLVVTLFYLLHELFYTQIDGKSVKFISPQLISYLNYIALAFPPRIHEARPSST
jgi:hypothetical protein